MIYALYHNETETIGSLADVLKQLGLPFREVHLYQGDGLPRDTGNLSGLILMGGPMSVDDVASYPFLFEEVRLIEKLVSEGRPILGICLGAQLIAKALDARVIKMKSKEIGWHPVMLTDMAQTDPVFSQSPTEFSALHWHGDTFELPKGAVHLARSAQCENQAFRWGAATYAVQFHLEATPSMVRLWADRSDGAKDLKDLRLDPSELLDKSPRCFEELKPTAEQIFTDYLNLAFQQTLAAR